MTHTPATSAAEYAERTIDENKQRELHPCDTGSIDLETFTLMSRDGQRRAWLAASDSDRRGLALQCIRRANHGPDEELIAQYVKLLDSKFGSDQAIPPVAELLDTVKERHATAVEHGDYAGARQLDRVRVNVLSGARLTWHAGDLLIQSVNHPGQVYSVNGRGCTCPNGAAGRSSCWHVCLFDLLLESTDDRAAAADILADADDFDPNDIIDSDPVTDRVMADAAGFALNLPGDDVPPARSLGSRIAAARSRYAA